MNTMRAFFGIKPKKHLQGHDDDELMFIVDSIDSPQKPATSFDSHEADEKVPSGHSIQSIAATHDTEDDGVFEVDEKERPSSLDQYSSDEEDFLGAAHREQITVDEISEDMRNTNPNDVEMMYDASLHSPAMGSYLDFMGSQVLPSLPYGSLPRRGPKRVGLEDFELLKVLGKGSFAKVMLVRKKDTQELYAMKVLRKETVIRRNQVEHTLTERNVMQEVQHPFVVSLQYAFQSQSKLYFVMDFLSGGELFFHLKRESFFSEEVCRFYSAEIVLALGHLHRQGIVYRDLKPENILLDADGHVRLTDFGLSKELKGHGPNIARTFCGTIEYMAPEVLLRTGHGKAVDWWSLGTLIFEMLTGAPPFYSKNRNVLQQKILTARLLFPSYMSDNAKKLLTGFLQRDVSKRLGASPEDSLEIMRHPWFAGVDWVGLLEKQLSPPFRPHRGLNPHDVNNFDQLFTRQTPKDTPVDSFLSTSADQPFIGFTYMPTHTLLCRPH